jgi:hypothetical protein
MIRLELKIVRSLRWGVEDDAGVGGEEGEVCVGPSVCKSIFNVTFTI